MTSTAPTTHADASRKRVLIAGAGITGLAAAYQIAKVRPDLELSVIEPRNRPGGNIQTERRDGFLLDGGPDSFLRTKPEAIQLCEELGLANELIPTLPTAHRVYVGQGGRLVPMPAGMALAVPTRLGPLVSTQLIGWGAKLRILGDLFTEKRAPAGDETVAQFLTRHFGREVTQQLAGPLLGGIFAGDIEELSIQATFPQLVELEKKQGSLIRALFAAERARAAQTQGKAAPRNEDPFDLAELWSLFGWLRREAKQVTGPFLSLESGMGTLVSRLVERLPEGSLRLERRIEALERQSDGKWLARLDGDQTEVVDRIVLCMPTHAAARVLAPHPISEPLEAVPYVSTATVFFALDAEPRECPLDGSGFIVPRPEGRMLASTWVSSKWAGRAPNGAPLVRAFLGGAREPELVDRSSEDDLLSLARNELTRFMGPLEPIRFARVFRWHRSNPQPTVGHVARVGRIRELAREMPGLYLAGSAYEGVGIPDCIRQGRAAADAALVGL